MADDKQLVVKATRDFPISFDGANNTTVKAGQVFACPPDLYPGLKAAGFVEDAEGAEPEVIQGQPEVQQVGAISGSTGGVTGEKTEVDAADVAKAAEFQPEPEVVASKPDIEPVEHGDVTIDRTLTRGVHGEAVAVEDADLVATAGKEEAAAEITAIEADLDEGEPKRKPGRPRKS